MRPNTVLMLTVAISTVTTAFAGAPQPAESPARQAIPADWLARWDVPPLEDRPLQIVHGIDPRRAVPEGIDQMIQGADPKRVEPRGMRFYTDRGLGGIVCNVAFGEYLRSEEKWKTLVAGVDACHKLGMVVWLYDEEGYPSGAAGGLVLEENPEFEATELAFDPSRDDPFIIRPAYEHTHASNNYYAARRYANLIDDRAVGCFIAKTHDAYSRRLGPYLGSTIQAMFTDEPSLIAINIGQIPEPARKRVRVVDPIDPEVRPLPRVPWCYDLAERYGERYGEDLMPRRRSLFVGDSPEDRRVRRQFWALVADLIAGRYFGAIQEWCGRHGIASSGHSLWEEALLHQVALEGNGLKALTRMDIPGLDVLTSNPEAVIHSGWMTAALPSSAAMLTGRRRVMTEVSDFGQKMGGQGPAGLDQMKATAAWQAAWGVTDFTLYYGIGDRPVEDYRAYCDYVGRLNAVLKPAQIDRDALLYYPIYDLWAEYLPVAEPLKLESQSPRAQRIVQSFMRLGRLLQRNQISFCLIDHEHLAAAEVRSDGKLSLGDHRFRVVLLPEDVELPTHAGHVVDQFRQSGGSVLADQPASRLTAEPLLGSLQPPYGIEPPSERITLGRFVRDGRYIVLAVNVGREGYAGRVTGGQAGNWSVMDPATGDIRPAERDETGRIRLTLEPCQAVLLVQGS